MKITSPVGLSFFGIRAMLSGAPILTAAGAPPRVVQSLDEGWRFHLGAETKVTDPGCDDSAWRVVDVPHDFPKFTATSYDEVYPGWDKCSSARNSWEAIATRPRIAGGFSWTGIDYRGEPTPFGWPSAGSFFSALDLCGFPKTEFFIRQAHWMKSKPVLTPAPHWNWAGKEGQLVKVMAMTNTDRVVPSLNGKLIGEKPVDLYQMVDWQVPYAPGKLEAVAKKGGREVARSAVETTGNPVKLRLTPDRETLAGNGSADGLSPATTVVKTSPTQPIPFVP